MKVQSLKTVCIPLHETEKYAMVVQFKVVQLKSCFVLNRPVFNKPGCIFTFSSTEYNINVQ